jgi:hypothetical protein
MLKDIKYTTDTHNRRYAACAYVHIAGSNVRTPGLAPDIVPIMPTTTHFEYHSEGLVWGISRSQLPMLPAYAFTNYKVQGRSFECMVIDLFDSKSIQSAYVMLSQAKSLDSVAIMRCFDPSKIGQKLPQYFCDVFDRFM